MSFLEATSTATGAFSLLGGAAQGIGNLIAATPNNVVGYQPNNQVSSTLGGIANAIGLSNLFNLSPKTLLFHYEGEQTVSFESDITDHYAEDNLAIQDQISLKPLLVTTRGFIGELTNTPPPLLAVFRSITQKLGPLNSFAPGLSTSAANVYNNVAQGYQAAQNVINSATAAVSSLSSITGGSSGGESVITPAGALQLQRFQTKQQTMFQQLYGYWQKRTSFTVQTPWAVIQNMYIYKLRAIQSEETEVVSEFELTFKQVRTVQDAVTTQVQSAITAAARAPSVNLGTVPVTAQSTQTIQGSVTNVTTG